MTSKLSIYAVPTHDGKWKTYAHDLQPYDILILSPDIQEVSDAYQASPESTITFRRWDWDDGRTKENPDGIYRALRDDPEGLARQHIAQYGALVVEWEQEAKRRDIPWPQREQLVAHLVNEPDTNSLMPQINRYTVVACNGLRSQFGLAVDALNLSTGHPAILRNGEPDWSPLAEALDTIMRGNHYAVVHEYYNDLGITDPSVYPWHIGRASKWAPRGPRYKVGEFSLEMILNGRMADHHGWQGIIPPERMVADTDWYLTNLRDDFVAVRFYMTDHEDRVWRTFGTEPIQQQLVEVGRRHPSKPFVPSKSMETKLPSIHNDGHTGKPQNPEVRMDIIDPLVGQTLIKVESAGRAFGPDDKPLIRFENHIFKTKLANNVLYARHYQHGSPVWTGHKFRRSESEGWQEVHTGNQASEYAAFGFALSLNRHAAYESISMGLGQIMGFNARRVGFPSAEAMFAAFHSEPMQMLGFINFFLSDSELAKAVRNKDWRTIARLYNGPGNVDHVAPLLESTYRQLGGI